MAGRASWKGGLGRDVLERLVAEGRPISAMARELDVSATTVRWWLARYGLKTSRSQRLAATRAAREAGATSVQASCDRHGDVTLVQRPGGGFRCHRCRNDAVVAHRRRVKSVLVAEAGGACRACGYAGSAAALQFHHLDPADKEFSIAGQGVTRSMARARAEAAKCMLLCANCHAEVEAGVRQLPSARQPLRRVAADPG